MNLQRILYVAIAWVAVAAAAVVCVVAASFAVYAVAKVWLGQAGAAAVVVGVFALLALALAWVATRKATPPKPQLGAIDDASLTDRLIAMAKERPLIALGAAAAASAAAVTVLVRNPALVTALVSVFLAGSANKTKP